jgi:NAD(P)-dependent dehydrogenase (short-subunit alcohol dehydrogenase family)
LRADAVRSRQIMERIPAARWGTPQDLAGVAVFPASAALTRYHAKMQTDRAKAIYKQRAPVVEFPNAWLKDKLK